MDLYPLINDYGEIVWRFQRKDLVQKLVSLNLASYDWYLGAYLTAPLTPELVEEVAEFARQENLTIHPNLKFGLTLDQPVALFEHYFMTHLVMSQAEVCTESLKNPLRRPLTPYQKAAVIYAVHTRCCFIADPDATDRQVAALAAVHQVQGYPCVLICREQEQADWIAQIRAYLPKDVCILGTGEVNKATPKKSIWLVDYTYLQHGVSLPANHPDYYSVIVDHAHYTKNRQARRTQEAAAITRKARYRFLVTDFPLNLSPLDLHEPLVMLRKHEEFDNLGGFLEQVNTDPLDNREMQRSNDTYQRKLAALFRKLRATCLVRRAVDPGLRAQAIIQPIPLGNIPARIDEDGVRSELRKLGLQKVEPAITWLRRFLDSHNGKVLIFAHHNDVVEEIAAALDIPAIYGKVQGDDQRRQIAARLANSDALQALVVASDVELDWDFGPISALVFAELLITPRQLYGIVDHVWEPEMAGTLPVHLLYARHTLDWEALKRLELRLTDYGQVMDGLPPEE